MNVLEKPRGTIPMNGDTICVVADTDGLFNGYIGKVVATYDDGVTVDLRADEDTPDDILDNLEDLFFEFDEVVVV